MRMDTVNSDKSKYIYNLVVNKISSQLKKLSNSYLINNIDFIMNNISAADLNLLLNNPKIYKYDKFVSLIINNLDKINYSNSSIYPILFNILDNIGNSDLLFNDKFYQLLDNSNCNKNEVLNFIETNASNYTKDIIVYGLKNWNNSINILVKHALDNKLDEIVRDNISSILSKTENIYDLNDITIDSVINRYVKDEIYKDKKRFIKEIVISQFANNPDTVRIPIYHNIEEEQASPINENTINLEEDGITLFLLPLLEEIATNENVDITSIHEIGSGSYSTSYRLGDKVIKIGLNRQTMSFNDNPYINRPLLRTVLKNKENNKNLIFVEVNQYLDTTNIGDEELYQLYASIRDIGLIWTDVRKDNVGRLLYDNQVNWKTKLEPSIKSLGLDEYVGVGNLFRGDIVILDNDYIYKDDNPKIGYSSNSVQEKYEKRYQEHLNNKKR